MTREKRIDFNKLSKPANLQNSAVLKMLEEEEERKRLGKPGLRRVEWPPTKEGSLDHVDFVEQNPVQSKEAQSPQSYYAPLEPPAALIALRREPPISQEPPPVYHSQPAATEAGHDGSSMGRGDDKWPPAAVRERTEADNRARVELAKGPACRPRRVNKDYRSFFAQHAVTNNYPGYRAPPGTQYFTPAYQQ